MRSAWRHAGHLHQLHVQRGTTVQAHRGAHQRRQDCRGLAWASLPGRHLLLQDWRTAQLVAAVGTRRRGDQLPFGRRGRVPGRVVQRSGGSSRYSSRGAPVQPGARSELRVHGGVLRTKGAAHRSRRGTPRLGGLWGCMIAVLMLLTPPVLGVRPVKGALVPLSAIGGSSSSRARSASSSLLWAVRCGALVAGAAAVAVRPQAAPVLRARAAGNQQASQRVGFPGLVQSTGRRPRGAWLVFAGRQESHS